MIDPTNPLTYDVINDVMTETASIFSDDYFHLGYLLAPLSLSLTDHQISGDEVNFACYDQVPAIKVWMQQHGLNPKNYADLIQYYSLKLTNIDQRSGKYMVFWQEAFNNAYKNPTHPSALPNGRHCVLTLPAADRLIPGTVIHIWKNGHAARVAQQVIDAGFNILFSAGWYLDQQTPNINGSGHYLWQDTFWDFYANEPLMGLNLTPEQLKKFLGGEAACAFFELSSISRPAFSLLRVLTQPRFSLWGEQADWANMWTRMLPRLAGTAERLWSPPQPAYSNDALNRAMSLRCRLAQRGFPASALAPDYCEEPSTNPS